MELPPQLTDGVYRRASAGDPNAVFARTSTLATDVVLTVTGDRAVITYNLGATAVTEVYHVLR